jgi:D-alanyl-D-alanine carboxypeptidase
LTAYALQDDDFCAIAQTLHYTVPANNVRTEPLEMTNTNRLLNAVEGDAYTTVYPYAIGIKTGDTDKAGKCLVAAAEREGARVIIAMFGDSTDLYNNDKELTNLARFVNAASIFDYVFDNEYQVITGSELGLQKSFQTGVANGNPDDLADGQLTMTADLDSVTIRALADRIAFYQASTGSITADIVFNTDVQAPVIAGQSMGYIAYNIGSETICTAPLTADFAVGEVLEVESIQQPEETAVVTTSPDSTPLITKGHKEWGTADVLTLVFILLIVLLIALIVVFVITERKRRYERKRRSARARKRKYHG